MELTVNEEFVLQTAFKNTKTMFEIRIPLKRILKGLFLLLDKEPRRGCGRPHCDLKVPWSL